MAGACGQDMVESGNSVTCGGAMMISGLLIRAGGCAGAGCWELGNAGLYGTGATTGGMIVCAVLGPHGLIGCVMTAVAAGEVGNAGLYGTGLTTGGMIVCAVLGPHGLIGCAMTDGAAGAGPEMDRVCARGVAPDEKPPWACAALAPMPIASAAADAAIVRTG